MPPLFISNNRFFLCPRNARIDFHVVSWDYAQTFPYQGDQPVDESDEKKAQASTNKGPVAFSWEVDVNGEITAHMSVAPLSLSMAVGSMQYSFNGLSGVVSRP